MPRVYISDKLEEAGMEILRAAGLEIDNRPGLKGEDLKEAIRAADGVVVGSALVDIVGQYGAEAPAHIRALTSALSQAVHTSRKATA